MIDKSLRAYRSSACKGRVTRSHIQRSVREVRDYVGIRIYQNAISSYGTEGTPWHKDGRVSGMRDDLEFLANQVELPNVEYIGWFHDGWGGIALPDSHNACLPIFVQEKTVNAEGIFTIPRSVQGFQREASMQRTAMRDNAIPFESKIDKAFFRGSTTGGVYDLNNWRTFARSKIVQLSLENPEYIDARFTSVTQSASEELPEIMKKEGFLSDRVPHDEQWKYKLIIVPDGNSVPDRLLDFLASNVVVLKQASDGQELWYDQLVPYKHFIPFKRDISDLLEVVKTSLKNQSLLQYISARSTEFVLENLNPDAMQCYLVQLLHEYAEIYEDEDI